MKPKAAAFIALLYFLKEHSVGTFSLAGKQKFLFAARPNSTVKKTHLILPMVSFFGMTSCAPPSTILVEETRVILAFF